MTDQTDTDALVGLLDALACDCDSGEDNSWEEHEWADAAKLLRQAATHLTTQAAQIAALTERDRQLCELVLQLVISIMEAGIDVLPTLKDAAERARAALETER